MNLGGDPEVNTWVGGLLTFVILVVTLAYASVKGVEFVNNTNPIISDLTIPNVFGKEDTVNLSEIGFKLAFAFRRLNQVDGIVNDPRFVSWSVGYVE